MNNFTILELGIEKECPSYMIGTILDVESIDSNFGNRLKTALSEHFDAEEIEIPEQREIKQEILRNDFLYQDYKIKVSGAGYEIRILKTWTY